LACSIRDTSNHNNISNNQPTKSPATKRIRYSSDVSITFAYFARSIILPPSSCDLFISSEPHNRPSLIHIVATNTHSANTSANKILSPHYLRTSINNDLRTAYSRLCSDKQDRARRNEHFDYLRLLVLGTSCSELLKFKSRTAQLLRAFTITLFLNSPFCEILGANYSSFI
jgi:hypothetical protein